MFESHFSFRLFLNGFPDATYRYRCLKILGVSDLDLYLIELNRFRGNGRHEYDVLAILIHTEFEQSELGVKVRVLFHYFEKVFEGFSYAVSRNYQEEIAILKRI